MPRYYRKSTPKVRGGKVQRKNRWELSPHWRQTAQRVPAIDRERAGPGYRHLVRRPQLRRFIELLPDWDELAVGLDAVLLAAGEYDCMGWHDPGVVAICAWRRSVPWDDCDLGFYEDHRALFDKLGVPCTPYARGPHSVELDGLRAEFDETTARAFQLIHVFIHELGHHHDRMTSRTQEETTRGESYAEAYARRWEDTILERYVQAFGRL